VEYWIAFAAPHVNAVLRPSHGVNLRGSAHCRLFPSHEMSEMGKDTTRTSAGQDARDPSPNFGLCFWPLLSLPANVLQPLSSALRPSSRVL
jgi:hypothetical protein